MILRRYLPATLTRIGRTAGSRPFACSLVGTTAGTLAVVALRGVALVVAANVLGPERQGALVVAMTAPALLALVGGLGLPGAIAIMGARTPSSLPALGRLSYGVSLAATAFGFLVVGLSWATDLLDVVLPGVDGALLLLTLPQLPIALIRANMAAILQSRRRVMDVVRAESLEAMLLVIGLVFLVAVGLGTLHWFALQYLLAALFGFTIVFRRAREAMPSVDESQRSPAGRTLLRRSIGLGLRLNGANVLQLATYRVDLYLVNLLIGPAAVGVYAVAVRVTEMLNLIPTAVTRVAISRMAEVERVHAAALTQRLMRVVSALLVSGGVCLALISPLLIPVVFGEAYDEAVPALRWLLPGFIAVAVSSIPSTFIASHGNASLNIVNSGVGLGVVVVLDIALIRRFGIVGASAASSAAYLCNLAISLLLYRRVARGSFVPHRGGDLI